MSNPVVSILVPVYNAGPYLSRCLDTILGQSYRDLQVVLVDDGSTDGSWEVMREYVAKDSRIETYHQENQGVSPTRNHLLNKVRGDYVLFVDSDDWIELDMVEYLVELAKTYRSGFVMCDRVMNNTPVSVSPPNVVELDQERAVKDFIRHDYFVGSLWNKLLASNLLHNERFHCGIWYGEDALFCWGVLQKVDKVVVSSRQLYHYRDVEQSISHQRFGEKKLTGYITWQILTEEVKLHWPEFTDLVLASSAKSSMYLLQAAAQCGYPKNDKIRELQRNIRKNYRHLLPLLTKDFKRWFYATMIMWWYGYGRMYYKLYQIRNR